MKFLIQLALIIVLIIVQSAVYPCLEAYNAFPNLILIMVLIIAILKGYKQGWMWIVFGGLLLDIYSYNNFIGISILSLSLIAYLASKLAQNVFRKNSIYSIITITIGGTLVYQIIIFLNLLVTGTNFQFNFTQIFFQVMYNIIVLIPFFYLARKFQYGER